MFADLSTNLSKYKTTQILLENCICTVNTGILKIVAYGSSEVTEQYVMDYVLQNVNVQFMRGIRRVSPVIQNNTVTG